MSNINKKSKQGAIALSTAQLIRFILQIITIMVVARILKPEDYGLTAIIFSLVSFGELLRDLGLSTASIQAKSISQEEKSNLFWINFLLGLLLYFFFYLISPVIASFYNDHRLDTIADVLSLSFVINGLTSQFKADLTRNLSFNKIAITDTVATLACSIVGIVCAYQWMSYWAIVAQTISLYLVSLLLYAYFSNWFPSLPSFSTNVRHFFNFGVYLTGTQIVMQLSKSVDSLVIGKQFGADFLGIYNRAQQLVYMGLKQISPVVNTIALPSLSKLQSDHDEYHSYIVFAQSVLLHLVPIAFITLAINADWIVYLILGEKWLECVPFMQILSFVAIIHAFDYAFQWVYLSKGLTKLLLKVNLLSRFVVVILIILGGFGSIYWVMIGMLIGLTLYLMYSVYSLRKVGENIGYLAKNAFVICSTYAFILSVVLLISNSLEISKVEEILFRNIALIVLVSVAFFTIENFRATFKCLYKLRLNR